MPPIKVKKTAAYELNGQLFANMPDAELAVRKAVILGILEKQHKTSFSLEDVANTIAQSWIQIKNDCDSAFAGI